MTKSTLLGVKTSLSMVEGKDDEAVMYVNSKTGFGSFRADKSVDHLRYMGDTDMEEGHR
jgi:hypothetical protein